MRWAGAGVLALLVIALAGCGSTRVQGFVRHVDTGEPLSGAYVAIDDATTATDPSGRFVLEVDDSDEPRRVSAQKSGYRSLSLLVPFDSDVDPVYRDLELHPRDEPRRP